MSKLYILQKCLKRNEVDMMVDIASSSKTENVDLGVWKYKSSAIEAPIPEVLEKYKKLLSVMDAHGIQSFKTIKVDFDKDNFIRPSKFSDVDEDAKFIIFTKVEEAKDTSGGIFRIFSDDGYHGFPIIEKYNTICFNANTKVEISRVEEGNVSFVITYAY